jgi:hypothetical protein
MEELQQYLQSIACLPLAQNLSKKDKRNSEKKAKNKEMNNLGP